MSYYQDLGVSISASTDEIRESYRTLVRLFHPDAQTDPTLKLAAEAQMRRLNEGHAVLSDPERRRHYDAELAGATERPAPIIIRAPRVADKRVRVPWGTVAWGSALFASAGLVLWLSSRDGPVTSSAIPLEALHPVTTEAAAARDPGDRATIAALRRELRLSNSQRDEAIRLLNQARQRPVARELQGVPAAARQAPEVSAMEPPPAISFPVASIRTPSIPALPARSHFAGMWLWARPRVQNRSRTMYPPEYIETTIVDRNGSLHGNYRARYRVADRAISPDVAFEFDGKASGVSVDLPFSGEGGARGEVRIRLISDNSIELKWSASNLGRSMGLSAGSAILIRKAD